MYTHHNFLIHSSADGHLAVVKLAAMNIGVHVPLSILLKPTFLIRHRFLISWKQSDQQSMFKHNFQYVIYWHKDKNRNSNSRSFSEYLTLKTNIPLRIFPLFFFLINIQIKKRLSFNKCSATVTEESIFLSPATSTCPVFPSPLVGSSHDLYSKWTSSNTP